MNINVGIVGATGHTGEELISVLLNHPRVNIAGLYNTSDQPQVISDVFPQFKNKIDLTCKKPNLEEIKANCEIVFLALPHTVSMGLVPKLLAMKKTVIDLSADYRIKNIANYEKFYQIKHKDKANINSAVYGLPELYRNKIKTAKLIANPGCYPTAAILGLAPLLVLGIAKPGSIIIDAKSGVSGAGKKISKEFLFAEINEDFQAYKVNTHQHAPEISQELTNLTGKKTNVVFVPHLLPINRGILETIYITRAPNSKLQTPNLTNLYRKFYQKEPFIRIKKEGEFPRIKDVANTNYCDIGVKDFGSQIIVISAIDNLLKGASGQAVQNMNIICGFPEAMGLK